MKARWRVWTGAAVAVGVAAIVWYLSLPYCHVVGCKLAFSTSDIVTNEAGLVVMVGNDRHYSDHRRNLQMRIDDCFGDRNRRLAMGGEYLKLHSERLSFAAIVSNAFSSVCVKVDGSEEVATAEITSKAEDRDVALDVAAYAVERLGLLIEEENLTRRDRALFALRSQLLGAQGKNGDAAELMKKLEAEKLSIEKHRERILLIKAPHVKYACRLPRGMVL